MVLNIIKLFSEPKIVAKKFVTNRCVRFICLPKGFLFIELPVKRDELLYLKVKNWPIM